MVKFKTEILKFEKQGDKTGWTYIVVPADVAGKIKPGQKRSFRVKGMLDDHPFSKTALLPKGKGEFLMPLNLVIRKAIRKGQGDKLVVKIAEDKSDFVFNADLVSCLEDEPAALKHFKSLTGSHQRYFSKWIDSAKTDDTKAKRIALSVNSLARGMGYPEMIRENTRKNSLRL